MDTHPTTDRGTARPTPPERDDGWQSAFDRLERLRLLKADWDDEGAAAPRPELIDAARRLAEHLRDAGRDPPSRVSARFEGTVVLEWQRPGYYDEFEVVDASRAERMTHSDGRPAVHEDYRW